MIISLMSVYLVDIVHSCEPVESEVHGVKHADNVDGLTQGADVGEAHHVTEQYCALFKFSCRIHKHTFVIVDIVHPNTV